MHSLDNIKDDHWVKLTLLPLWAEFEIRKRRLFGPHPTTTGVLLNQVHTLNHATKGSAAVRTFHIPLPLIYHLRTFIV